jgi:hypothetical protein
VDIKKSLSAEDDAGRCISCFVLQDTLCRVSASGNSEGLRKARQAKSKC